MADYLILDTRPNDLFPGLCVWWKPERCGYTSFLSDAGRYTEREAKAQGRRRSTDVAVPFALAEELSRPVVDACLLRRRMEKLSDA